MHEMISFDAADNITPEQAAELALGVWRDVLDIDNHQHRWGVHTDTDQNPRPFGLEQTRQRREKSTTKKRLRAI